MGMEQSEQKLASNNSMLEWKSQGRVGKKLKLWIPEKAQD